MGLKFGLNIRVAHFIIIVVLISAFALLLILQLFIFTSPAYAETATKKNTTVSVSPQLSIPEDNSIKNGSPLIYSWQPIEGADHYVYESYDDPELTVVHEHQIIVNDMKFERFEEHEAEIWWRTKAVFTSGDESGWSETRRVVIDNIAPTIQNITEGDTARVSGTAVFKFEITDSYPDKIIASMDGALMPMNQTRESARESRAQAQRVTVRITLNIDTLPLSDGAHSLTVRAIDHAENLSDPLEINFLVANTPPVAEKEPESPTINKPVEVIQTIALPETPPIAPILGGEQVATNAILSDDSAVTHAETKTTQEPILVNTHNHPVERPYINFGWPMWLGFGALLSGTGWWMFSGRKRP